MSELEKDFSEIFFNIIKSFNLVLGYKSVIIAKNIFDKSSSSKLKVSLTDQSVDILCGKIGKREEKALLMKMLKNLRNAYLEEVGEPAARMIAFVLEDFKKYKFPKIFLSGPDQ